ncbi:DUF4493 domain-containing protein [Bacteroides difficilis]|uniref:DUF4493 domain-containing protein n=1 Tax=Bacteroides difficilis TaxID=2763021 RepID=UPI003AADAA5C
MKMKEYYLYWLLLLFFFTGCQRDEYTSTDGEGSLRLSVGMKNDLKVVATRALTSEEQAILEKDCKVRIYQREKEDLKLVRKYQGVENVPADILLASGDYQVKVTAGEMVSASFDKKFYEGIKSFTITKGADVKVDVVANVGNTVATVAFAETMNPYFENCTVGVAVKAENGILDFTADDAGKLGYFSVPVACDTLFCTFEATNKLTGAPFVHIDTIPDVVSATLYNLTYEFKESEVEVPDTGGGMINLVVDVTPIGEVETEETIYRRPSVKAEMGGQNLVLTQPAYMKIGDGEDMTVMIKGSTELTQIEIASEQFPDFLGAPTAQQAFDLKNLTTEEEDLLANGGITIDKKEASLGHAMDIKLSASLIRKYTAENGTRNIRFSVTDQRGYQRIVDWQIVASDIAVQTVAIPDDKKYLIWATKATLFGEVLPEREPQSELSFRYRKVGTTEWQTVPAVRNGSVLTAEVTGLKNDDNELFSEYEYQVMEGTMASNVKCQFTTEKTLQLENCGFEEWSGSAPAYIAPSSNDSDIFWDSGNHGSATLGRDVTTPDTNVKHSGNRSAKLTSQKVVTQFAAGNLFTGRYLQTEMSGLKGDGILGWGRPFTSRPIALTGWIRYNSGKVNYADSHIGNNEQDQGYIFIALGDWQEETYTYKGVTYSWERIVATKVPKLFDHTTENKGTIAHGEQTWMQSTDEDLNGTKMYPFTIRLDYWDEERIPTTIIVVASASKFGDFFAGSTSSVMWLDDLKLIYDESEITE